MTKGLNPRAKNPEPQPRSVSLPDLLCKVSSAVPVPPPTYPSPRLPPPRGIRGFFTHPCSHNPAFPSVPAHYLHVTFLLWVTCHSPAMGLLPVTCSGLVALPSCPPSPRSHHPHGSLRPEAAAAARVRPPVSTVLSTGPPGEALWALGYWGPEKPCGEAEAECREATGGPSCRVPATLCRWGLPCALGARWQLC